jgi:hypothetical protein
MLQLAAAAGAAPVVVVLASRGSSSAVVRQCIEGAVRTRLCVYYYAALGEQRVFWCGRTRGRVILLRSV